MDFSEVKLDLLAQSIPALQKILNLNLSKLDKHILVARFLREIGETFYLQMFEANSEVFGSQAIRAAGDVGISDGASIVAYELIKNDNLGRPIEQFVSSYYNTRVSKAQDESFKNAYSLGKHPVVTRTLRGDNCPICRGLAGTHTYSEDGKNLFFRCCSNCNCLIVTSGFNTRNGEVKNYIKRKAKK